MKNLQGRKFVAMLVALMFCTVAFMSCDSEKMSSVAGPEAESAVTGDINRGSLQKTSQFIYGSNTFRHQNNNGYQGGRINLSNGSSFVVANGALTPPPGTPHGADVTITVEIEIIEYSRRDKEMIVTFQPSGCQFGPNAELWLDWHDLGSKDALLYLLDNDGNRIPINPDSYDRRGKKIMRLIPHFSRYALVHA